MIFIAIRKYVRKYIKKYLRCLSAAAALLILLSACTSGQSLQPQGSMSADSGEAAFGQLESPDTNDKKQERLKIVTTVFAPYDFMKQLTDGIDADISMLLPPGAEVHSYDPTVQDIIKISECDLFIYTGGENDEWVGDILDSLDEPVNTFRMIEHVDSVVEEEIKEGMQTSGQEEESNHDAEAENEPEWDEHVWTSPQNAIDIVNALTEELCALDQENSDVYHNNLLSYSQQLKQLDDDFRLVTENAPHKVMIFADRFPVRYFTEEYGLDYYAAYPGCAADAEPSAATMCYLIDRVRDEDIKAVFYIEMSDERIADTVCEETGARKLLFHSCHNVTREEMKKGATYISLMRDNLKNLKIALY